MSAPERSSSRPQGSSHSSTLKGTVAVVTGASRGAGRAIAKVLGEAGATVYVTGRSTRAHRSPESLPGTVEDAAELVTSSGGRGIAVRVDHTVDEEVRALFSRVREEQGRLDVLVNNAWGGYEQYEAAPFDAPCWEQPFAQRWEAMFTAGVRAHLVASSLGAPLLMRRGEGERPALLVSTVAWAFGGYLGNLYYDVAKAALIRMVFGLAQELRPHHVAAVALAPGFMRTERVMDVYSRQPFDLGPTESPEFLGRAVAALAADPHVLARSGHLLTAGELAREYHFTDVDGRQPEPFRLPEGS